jgi:hypothetical protein
MAWYGMVWYGMVWYGMVWYGMVWYGMVWYGMVWQQHTSLRVHTMSNWAPLEPLSANKHSPIPGKGLAKCAVQPADKQWSGLVKRDTAANKKHI